MYCFLQFRTSVIVYSVTKEDDFDGPWGSIWATKSTIAMLVAQADITAPMLNKKYDLTIK